MTNNKKHKRKKPNPLRHLDKATHQILKMIAYESADGICQSPIYNEKICRGKPYLSYRHAHLDHIIPISQGGTNDFLNLRILCNVCHALRYGKEHLQLREEMRADGKLPKNYYDFIWRD